MTPLRIVYAGTPDFAVPALGNLLDSAHQVVAVMTQPDRPAGRGRQLKSGPVKQLAEQAGCTILQPPGLRKAHNQRALLALEPDLIVVAAYGLILPPEILALPRLGCWNLHASLLPRWRGAAPIHRALLAGDRQTGVCLMQMDAGLDTGAVLATVTTPILPTDTGQTLHDRLAQLGASALDYGLAQRTSLVPQVQDDQQASYADKLTKSEADLDWRRPAVELERQVRAFNPWPVARSALAGQTLRVWQARLLPKLKGPPGMVLATGADGIDVATGCGALRVQQIQRPGGRAMAAGAFLNACPIEPGQRFECP